VFALEFIEIELLGHRSDIELSNLRQVVDTVMIDNPEYWQKYYLGTAEEQAYARKFSFSDRIWYYWLDPKVQAAVLRMFNNLDKIDIPLPLLSQFFPKQYQ
jgi:D-tagatose-1,6-bisphosphate aldolase subunit GatZ/KbaZ